MNIATAASLSRRIEKYRTSRRPFMCVRGQLFTVAGGIIEAFSPAAVATELDAQDGRQLIKGLGGFLVRYTDGFHADNGPRAWYSVISRKVVDLGTLPKSKRYQVNRSLKHFDVRQLSAQELAQVGYRTLVNACERYKRTKLTLPTEAEFKNNVAREADFPDLVHNWGVYLKDSNTLAGYAQNQVFDHIEANYSTIKLDPGHFQNGPGYALVYRMNEFYLGQGGFEYVNDGFKAIYHLTQFQNTLLNALGFEKAYTKLNVYYPPLLGRLVRWCYPLRSVLGRMDRRLAALLEQERCVRLA